MGARHTAFVLLTAGVWAQPGNSRVCAGCHREIWETYQRTGMGRSFYQPSPENMVEDLARHNTYYHAASESWFAMLGREGKYFQRRWQVNAGGQPINVMEKQIHYIMGSGNHARTYLHRTPANTLIELPLGWYAEKGGYWGMNPGYDRPDHEGFRRSITYDCMFCHNAYPKIPAKPAAESVYSGPLPEGIDCGRCHGPGLRHAQLAGTPGATPAQIRQAIVNPGRLPAQRQMDICMSCHLETTSFPLPNAIQRYERGPFSFRPGEPLGDFILNFDHAPGTGREDKFEIVNAAYRLRRSACFLQSKGKMLCTSCHNPHAAPRDAEAVKHYDAACRQCHGALFQQAVTAGRHTAQADCASCHMPKRRTEDVIHVAVTDHWIQRLQPAGDLLADRQEIRDNYRGPVALYYPETLPRTPESALYLAVAQVKQKSNLATGLAQLTRAIERFAPRRAEWYLELAEGLASNGQLDQGLPWYRESVRRDPASAVALQKLGTALRRSSAYPAAADALKRAAALAPDRALTWHELGLVYRAQGRTGDAVAALRAALKLDPEMPEAHNNLGILTGAEASFREAIRIKPDYADAHGNLAHLLSGAGRFPEAGREFDLALRLRPGDAATRYNYAMLLGRTKRYDEAQRELEACLQADPKFAGAHELLGDLLMARNEPREAVAHYRELLQARPGSGRAQLGLALALLAAGDRTGALPLLQKAADAADADVRQRAVELLRQLGSGK